MHPPKIGSIQVNTSDYASGVVVECFDYHNRNQPMWAVPAWDEQGWPNIELAGPFATRADAERAIEKYHQAFAMEG